MTGAALLRSTVELHGNLYLTNIINNFRFFRFSTVNLKVYGLTDSGTRRISKTKTTSFFDQEVQMGQARRFAVISARHDSQPALTLADCRQLFETSQHSIISYWRSQSAGWFIFPDVTYFGPVDIQLPPPPHARRSIFDTARAAVEAMGGNLSGFDNYVVFLSRGKETIPNPNGPMPPTVDQGYDSGASGLGPGEIAVLVAFESNTFFCHEVGHLLGFDHTWGILNHGIDWSGTGATSNVYGDPYDIMSASSFGDANPTFNLPANESVPGFSGMLTAGPALSRALLHFQEPLALETAGLVRHVSAAEDTYVTLRPAGPAQAGLPELLVWHPAAEDGAGRGRVYVEFRQYGEFDFGTYWDQGLATTGDDRTRMSIVVHTVLNATGLDVPVVWYAGRIVLPAVDTDVRVETAFGPMTVSVDAATAAETNPPWVRVKVSPSANPRLWLSSATADTKSVIASEKRIAPGFPFMGPFTWETRQVLRRMTIEPLTAGLGLASFDRPDTLAFNWKIDSQDLDLSGANTALTLNKNGREVTLDYSVDPIKRTLTLSNRPAEGAFDVAIRASVSDPNNPGMELNADETFSAPPIEEGWGEDFERFMEYWDRITNPLPKPRIGPPDPGPVEELRQRLAGIEMLNPDVGLTLRTMLNESVRSQAISRAQPVLERANNFRNFGPIQQVFAVR